MCVGHLIHVGSQAVRAPHVEELQAAAVAVAFLLVQCGLWQGSVILKKEEQACRVHVQCTWCG